MKKSLKKKLRAAFWVVFLIGLAWASFAPHKKHSPSIQSHTPPPSVTVKVQHPPQPFLPPQVDILIPPSDSDSDQPAQTYEETAPAQSTVTVPVKPEPRVTLSPGQRVKIAIVIDDMGADIRNSERALRLPPGITLSFLPYGVRTRELAKEAREKNHEVLLHLPMEPVGHENPGPGALLVGLPSEELRERLHNALASFTGFDGVNNHMGSKFTADPDGMALVIDDLLERNLFFLDSRTSGQTVAEKIAQEKHLPSIARDVFLDDTPTPQAIRKQLEMAEHVARRKGFAVVIGHPHTATIEALEAWAADAANRGFDLVPVRVLVVTEKDGFQDRVEQPQ